MDALHDALISIRRILRATEIHAKALRAATNLKTSQLMVLQALEDGDDMTVGAITQQVRMAQASVTAIVVKLERMGLVVRERGIMDKRKVFVRLTELGHNVLEEAPEAVGFVCQRQLAFIAVATQVRGKRRRQSATAMRELMQV